MLKRRNNTSLGMDDNTAEMLRAGYKERVQRMCQMLN